MSNFKVDRNLRDILLENTAAPAFPALTFYAEGRPRERYNSHELGRHVATAAHELKKRGVRAGERVVVLSGNSPHMYFLCLAIMACGAIVAPMNPRETPRVLGHTIASLEPTLIVASAEAASRLVEEVGLSLQLVRLNELFAGEADCDAKLPAEPIDPDATAVILFTSGTTSRPKGVCLSHANLLTNAEGLREIHRLDDNRVHMCVLPLFHANAFGFSLVTSTNTRSHVVLCDGLPGFRVWDILEKERVNIISVVPQILQLLASRPPAPPLPCELKYVVSAAAPLSRKVAEDFYHATGVRIHQGYGLSECVNFATTVPSGLDKASYEEVMFSEKVTSIGVPLRDSRVQVRSLETDAVLGARVEGEITVSGPTLMKGYWRDHEATEKAIVNGELRTGDLGFFIERHGHRYFHITGRKKEIIIRHGEKFSPLAIELELQALQGKTKFAVTGFKNGAVGEEIGLYVQIGDELNQKEIRRMIEACPAISRPRVVLFGHGDIPMTPTGKVRRDVLAQQFSSFASRYCGESVHFAVLADAPTVEEAN